MDIRIRLDNKTPGNRLPSYNPIKEQPEKEGNVPPVNEKPLFKSQMVPEPPKKAEPDNTLRDIYRQIDQLIGLKQVKKLIYEVQAFINIQQKRQKVGLKAEPIVLHAIFRGNPGSGKTTMARLLGSLFCQLGILSKGHIIEVERADLVGEYIGHTAKKTKEHIAKAKGGILFIDEAYSLARGGSKDFGREAIDALVKGMEDFRDDFILILAGYHDEMGQFLATNPGLNSRFPLHIDFPDYTLQELLEIAAFMYRSREYVLTPAARVELNRLLEDTLRKYPRYHGNGRLVRNIVEASLRKQAVRLMEAGSEPENSALAKNRLMEIIPVDLQIDMSQMIAKPAKTETNGTITDLSEYLKQLAEG